MCEVEFQESEELHCQCLRYLWRQYVQPNLIKYPDDDAARAFGSALLGVHMNHQELLRVVRDRKVPFWEVLQLHMLSLSSSYLQYTEAQPPANEFLAKIAGPPPHPDEDKLPSTVDGRPSSLAATPFQRVPRYALLLEQRLKAAIKEGDTTTESAISKALQSVNGLCQKINLLQMRGHSDGRKADLVSKLGLPSSTFGHATIIGEGTFQAKTAGASHPCIAVLTTDELTILCCKDPRRHKVKVVWPIALTDIRAVRSTSSPLSSQMRIPIADGMYGVIISYDDAQEVVLEVDDDLLASQWVMDLSIAIDAACHRSS